MSCVLQKMLAVGKTQEMLEKLGKLRNDQTVRRWDFFFSLSNGKGLISQDTIFFSAVLILVMVIVWTLVWIHVGVQQY